VCASSCFCFCLELGLQNVQSWNHLKSKGLWVSLSYLFSSFSFLFFSFHDGKLVFSLWNKEELADQWKESIIVSLYKKGDKTDCSNYLGMSLLSASYKILSNILFSRLSPYIVEIIGDHLCGFQHNRSTADQMFCICQLLEKIWEYNETVHQLFIDFKKAYDPVRGKYYTVFS
jgi:hypothetical protein